jgi:hypothetical protein
VTIKLEVTGAKALQKKMRDAARDYPEAVRVAVYQAGFMLLRAAIKFPAPRYFGVLIRSGYVSPPSPSGDPVVEVGFGTKYARRQHYEHRERRLYLQKPLDEMRGKYLATIANLVRRAVSSNRKVGAITASFPATPREPTAQEVKENARKRYVQESRRRKRAASAANRRRKAFTQGRHE